MAKIHIQTFENLSLGTHFRYLFSFLYMFDTIAQFSPNPFMIQSLNTTPLSFFSPLFAKTGKTILSKNANFWQEFNIPFQVGPTLYSPTRASFTHARTGLAREDSCKLAAYFRAHKS